MRLFICIWNLPCPVAALGIGLVNDCCIMSVNVHFPMVPCPSMVTRPPHPRWLPHSNFCQLLWGFDDFMSVNGEKRSAPCRALLSDCSFCAHNCAQRQQGYFAFRSHFCARLINAASQFLARIIAFNRLRLDHHGRVSALHVRAACRHRSCHVAPRQHGSSRRHCCY